MLPERLKAVLNESTAIGTFLLIPLTVQTFAGNRYEEEEVYGEEDPYF